MSKQLLLTAGESIDITASFMMTATVDKAKRTISGTVVSYGEIGNTSHGKTRFTAGGVSIPEDVTRVKLLEMHDQERSVGHMVSYDDNAERLYASYRVVEGAAGDAALEAVENKSRDAFSLGANIGEYVFDEDDVLVVSGSTLLETSLVTIPAFSNSRIDQIAANRKGMKMTEEEKRKLAEARALVKAAADAEAAAALTAGAAPQGTPAPVVEASAPAPFNAPQLAPLAAANAELDLDGLAMRIAAGFQNGGGSAASVTMNVLAKVNPKLMVTAALTDVVPADDGGTATDATRSKWIGELWQASRTERPTIDSLGKPERLTSMKVHGYKLVPPKDGDVPRHMVNKYAGSKTPIPASAKWKTAPESATADRWAGGWDVDRIFFDFNDYGYVKANIRGAFEDYLMQTEAAAVARMLAAATPVAGADVLELLANMGAAASALGSTISKIQFGSAHWAQFTTLTTAEVPWWLQKQGSLNLGTNEGNAGNMSFNVNHELGASEALASDKRAATYYETPVINVQAIDIANGGVDLGVFGYDAMIINDARAIFKAEPPVVAP